MKQGDVTCECIDYCKNRNLCKHILFVVSRIGKVPIMTKSEYVSKRTTIFENLKTTFDKLKNKCCEKTCDSTECSGLNLRNEECYICYDALTKDCSIEKCSRCDNGFHKQCLSIWKQRKNTCPMCRSQLLDEKTSQLDGGEDHALKRFTGVITEPLLPNSSIGAFLSSLSIEEDNTGTGVGTGTSSQIPPVEQTINETRVATENVQELLEREINEKKKRIISLCKRKNGNSNAMRVLTYFKNNGFNPIQLEDLKYITGSSPRDLLEVTKWGGGRNCFLLVQQNIETGLYELNEDLREVAIAHCRDR